VFVTAHVTNREQLAFFFKESLIIVFLVIDIIVITR
jgi:hypothetical protein